MSIDGPIPTKKIIRKLNTRGYLAGRVLKDTNGLKKIGVYEFFIDMWYMAIFFALLLIILQIANSTKDLFFENEAKQPVINNYIVMPTPLATPTTQVISPTIELSP